MKGKISVIVPVYNAEDYLPECIESIISQDYGNLEVLLVDDGSQDGSPRICGEYAARFGFVRFLRQENSGASTARNHGLDKADGEYVVFVDADDYLPEQDILSGMIKELEAEKADILVGNYVRLWNGRFLPAASCSSISRYSVGDRAFRFQGFFAAGTLSYIWAKAYRRSFLEEKKLRFCAYRYGEDKLFNFECYIQGARYAFFERPVYVYRKNDNSVSYRFREDSVDGWMGIAERTHQLLSEKGIRNECGDLVACTIFFAAFFDGKMNYVYGGKKISAVKRVLKEYGKRELAAVSFSELSRRGQRKGIPSLMWRIMIWGFALGMRLHCYSLLSFGIKLLVDLRIDERLSDTGLRE